jgi:hypothetical protein
MSEQGMIRKSGDRFSDKIMPEQEGMIRKSGDRFSEKIMRKQRDEAMIRHVGP